MQWLRIAFAFMLIMALVPAALSVTPSNVLGQGYVTITTQTTTTGLYSSAATTHYQTTVLTTTTTYDSGLIEVDGTDSNPGTNPPCGWASVLFQATKDQHVSGSVKSEGPPISFYVMSDSVRKNWRAFGYPVDVGGPNSMSPCHGAADGSLIIQNGITSYTISLDFPSNGTYWFWFINVNSSHTPFAVDFELLSSPIVSTSTVSSISYVTAPTTELLAFTTMASQVGLPFGSLGMLAPVVAVAVIAGVLVIARRRKTSGTTTLVHEQPATVLESPKVVVAPQPVTPTKTTQSQPVISEIPSIISTGYADLDKALDGGIPEEFAVVIVSPSYDERDLLLRKVVNSAMSSGRLAILISNDIGRTKDMASRYPNEFYALSPQADRISQHGPNLLKIPSFENLSEANISLRSDPQGCFGKGQGN